MCGIIGYINNKYIDLSKFLHLISHRGPDAKGTYYKNIDQFFIGLGHVRLSILDLTPQANQPFISNDGNYIIVYNGEIYNFNELQQILKKEGFVFRTNSDTEVLLNLYIQYKEKMLNFLDGMFAFAILDLENKSLFCARDEIGIKPFYYFLDTNKKQLFFSSEIAPLLQLNIEKKISETNLVDFLFNGWIYEPDTIYKKIKKLKPGEYLKINLNNFSVKKKTYFDILEKNKFVDKSIEEILFEETKLQTISDVNIGNFFSGGIDSTLIATILGKKIKNLMVFYEKSEIEEAGLENDYIYAKKIQKLLNLDVEYIPFSSQLSNVDKIKFVAQHSDELISDFTFISTYLISQIAKNNDFKVMLSGMGGDEFFAGYPRYKIVTYKSLFNIINSFVKLYKKPLLNNKNLSKKIDRFESFFKYEKQSFSLAYSHLIGYFSLDEINNIFLRKNLIESYLEKMKKFDKKISNLSNLKKSIYLDIYGFLSHNFIVTDKASMLNSLEVRVPLANKKILQKVFYMRDRDLIDLRNSKKPLKKILHKFLPKDVVNRKKVGFNPPLDKLIFSLGYDFVTRELKNSPIFEFIDKRYTNIIIKEHFDKKKNNTYKIWQILFLHYWLKYHVY